MKIIPLGADSFGTRSFSFGLELKGRKVVIDPSCALAPKRGGLPPHPLEIEKLRETYKNIRDFTKKSDIVIITHYHNDHYPFFDIEVFKDKFLLLKEPFKNMNHMQIIRAKKFLEDIKTLNISYDFADGKVYKFDGMEIEFSAPLWHGRMKKQGKCIAVCVKEKGGEKALFSSDIQGLWEEIFLKFLYKSKAQYFFIDGPSIYQSSRNEITEFLDKIKDILKSYPNSKVVIDHHFSRDLKFIDYLKKLKEIFGNEKILSCAEFKGVFNSLLEAKRRELYGI